MDGQEFDEFFVASYRRITGQLYVMLGDHDVAEECVQEAFARAWVVRHRLGSMAHPEAYVRTAAYRLAVSRWRRVVRSRRPTDRAVGPALETGAPSEAHVVLVEALKTLPEAQRQALVLHHIADLSVHDVAREVGVPEGTIKARLSRGRAALAALLADPSSKTDCDSNEGVSHA